MKRILLILALMILGLGLNAQKINFSVTNELKSECCVSGYQGPIEHVTIPSTVTSSSGKVYTVTSIRESAFDFCKSLTSIEIPSSVTSIGDYAFRGCDALTSVAFGDNSQLTSIGDYAFRGCYILTSIDIPSGVTSIGNGTFCSCGLTSIEIPSGVTSIGDEAFAYCCYLTSIDIPSGVTSIGNKAFEECSSLTSIDIPSGVTSIGNGTFYACGLTSIEIPSGVTSIGDYAFRDCSSLTSIEIPSSVTSIGDYAFRDCSSLTSIEIPSSVTSIGDNAFFGCSSLTSIIVESGNTVYDSRNACNAIIKTATNTLIAGCKNTIIPNSVTSIGDNAFIGCSSLTSIEIPNSVISIGESAFDGCSSLISVTFGDNSQLTSIGDYAFWSCSSLTSVTFGDNSQLTSIGESAFEECSSLISVTFGDNSQLTSIGDYAFEECSSLISIEIPSSVTSIGYYAFRDCSNLRSVICHAENVPAVDGNNNPFSGCPSDMVIYVPANSGFSYAAKSPWNQYTLKAIQPHCEVTVAVSPDKAGIVTGAGSYEINGTVTVTATSNEGYKFVSWTEDGKVVSEEAEYTFVIKSDRNLVANFELLTYEVKTSVNIENAGEITGDGNYNHGDTVSMIATANTGYKFLSWMENGEVVSEEAEYTFVITSDRNLVANFELLTYEVKTSVNIENAGEVTGDGNYNHGDTVALIATANEGYAFVNWTEDGEVISSVAEYSFVILKDRNIVANFEKLEDPEQPEEPGEGVEELTSSFNIYPNPVNDKLYIETQTQTQTVEIYDVYGRRQSMVNGQQSTVIDVSDLNSGVYFVKVVTNEGDVVKRFVKK